MDLKKFIISVQDFPIKDIDFKDITPILNNVEAFRYTVEAMSQFIKEMRANVIVAPEARGFLFASAVAFNTGSRLVIVRKQGKLPRQTYKIDYELEYSTNTLEMTQGDILKGDRVAIIDDILATGGTIEAIIKLIKKEQANIVGLSFLADLSYLHPQSLFDEYSVQALITY